MKTTDGNRRQVQDLDNRPLEARGLHLVDEAVRYLFFTGKGGVGKTSVSCATAIALADQGRKVLLVSTDPASNIDEVLAQPLGQSPVEISDLPGLHALNIAPEEAARDYREKVVGPYRGVLPDAVIASMEEQLSGACTVEIAAFDEFAKLIGKRSLTEQYDHVIFDTAPTGHTLRLLSLPAAWSGFISNSTSGVSCLGPLHGLAAQKELYAHAVAALTDASLTSLVLVTRPARAPLQEAARSSRELAAIGIANQQLVVNGTLRVEDPSDPIAAALERQCTAALAAIPAELKQLKRTDIDLKPRQLVGLDQLRAMFAKPDVTEAKSPEAETPEAETLSSVTGNETHSLYAPPSYQTGLSTIVDEIARSGHGVVMTMGKGGVGKSTIAAGIAAELAARGYKVHMSTTDPAGSALTAGEQPVGVTVDRIDPQREVERYRREVIETTGRNLDADALALLKEDLASPCTEEIAIFQAFAATVNKATNQFVVLDTAPTGHTILLLDAAQSFSREVSRQSKAMPDAVTQLLPRLRDRDFTHVILCTLGEATPVHEAAALQADLRRAGIEPFAWIANQCLAGLDVRDPLLAARKRQERIYLDEIAREHASHFALMPLEINEGDAGCGCAASQFEGDVKSARGHAYFA